MSTLSDLVITLTSPPPSALDALATITLHYGDAGLKHSGDLLHDPFSEQERADLRWYLEDYWKWPYAEFRERARGVEATLEQIGARLYAALFGSIEARDLLQAWRYADATQRQISVISDIPAALSLPWELLRDTQGYLLWRSQTPIAIIRRLSMSEGTRQTTPFAPPLRVLLVTARPEGTGFVDPRGIARELLDEVQAQVEQGAITVEFLRPPTLSALRERLRDAARPVHVLHFDGHGVFKPDRAPIQMPDGRVLRGGAEGMLAFENDDGTLDLVPAERLAGVLQDAGVRLAVLTACQSALGAADDAFSSVAERLIRGGVGAVVAMSASVLVVSAARYVEAFYRDLAAGTPATVAHERARQALHDQPGRHVVRRNRDDPGTQVALQDWWLPHFYQQRPVELSPSTDQPQAPLSPSGSPAGGEGDKEETLIGMPPAPRYGWFGRARELQQIERHLRQGKLVVIHGFGGQGKTALTRESADWLVRTGMFGRALFVSFEHGGDSQTLLAALGTALGVNDGDYRSDDRNAALGKLRPALQAMPTLLIADNMESVLPNGDAALPADERAKLWETLLALASITGSPAHPLTASRRCGVLLTTRDTSFGDGRMAAGRAVAHLPLGGLWPDDAYALATQLIKDLGIPATRAPYVATRALLEQLDQHPLAIQLVLPSLKDLSLDTIRADFATYLDRFAEPATDHQAQPQTSADGSSSVVGRPSSERNRSLLASLDYSLRRLSDEQRALLPRMAPFEGGASEDDLPAITEIPEAEWATLRPALEQAALVRAEQVPGVRVPFLQFHPVLTPYLRGLPGADDPALQERFMRRYYALANYFYQNDSRSPQAVRALVQRELPNLRRALHMLLQAGDADAAVDMADSIARFLNNFGLRRELAELRAQVAAALLPDDGELTGAAWLRETGAGEDEYRQGNLQAAHDRFTRLLQQHEALPDGTPLGRGSYEHCLTLGRLARCLRAGGQPGLAEMRLREAIGVIDALIAARTPAAARLPLSRAGERGPGGEGDFFLRQRGALLTDLGDVLAAQGNFAEAQAAYEESLQMKQTIGGDERGRGAVLGQLGSLALDQRRYAEADERYQEVLKLFGALDEPAMEAVAWHQLGMVAQEQRHWEQAERCYREALRLKEQLGDIVGVARTGNQLAIVAEGAGRLAEAEGWYKRALELSTRSGDQVEQARNLNNLANLLLAEVQAGRAARARLGEARGYAERARAIRETLDASAEIWTALNILAGIADEEGRADDARALRRRERVAFAAFAGNRWHIDEQHGALIGAIVAAARGDREMRAAVEGALPQLEARGWKIADATRRVWNGERDWHALCENIDRNSALLVLRVLEELG